MLRKCFVVWWLVLTSIACQNPAPSPISNCSLDCGGALAATPNALCSEYNPMLYAAGAVRCATDCTVDVTGCELIADEAGQVYEACTGATEGSPSQGTCEEGLHCLGLGGGTDGYCLLPCSDTEEETACGTGVCLALNFGSYCLKKESERDAPCGLDVLSMCVDDAGSCFPTGWDFISQTGNRYRCKVLCDGEHIGQQGSCGGDDVCIANALGIYFPDPENEGNCTTPSDCSDGFDCISTALGQRCGKYQGWCGDGVSLCGEVGWTGLGSCMAEIETTCSLDGGHDYCLVSGISEDFISETAFVADARTYCVNAGEERGICVGICEADGVAANCGVGYTCGIPENDDAIFYTVERDGADNWLYCEDDDGCSEAYHCRALTIGSVCSKPSRQCQRIESSIESE